MNSAFTIEDKLFLKQLGINNKIELIKEIESMEADDELAEEFLKDIIDKINKIKEDKISF